MYKASEEIYNLNHKDIKHLTFQPIIRYGDSVIGTTPLLLRKNNNIFITTINNLFDNNYYTINNKDYIKLIRVLFYHIIYHILIYINIL